MPDVAAFELPPDWACEVLSESTSAFDRGDKLPIFAREKVGHVWFVDPIVKTLEVLLSMGRRTESSPRTATTRRSVRNRSAQSSSSSRRSGRADDITPPDHGTGRLAMR